MHALRKGLRCLQSVLRILPNCYGFLDHISIRVIGLQNAHHGFLPLAFQHVNSHTDVQSTIAKALKTVVVEITCRAKTRENAIKSISERLHCVFRVTCLEIAKSDCKSVSLIAANCGRLCHIGEIADFDVTYLLACCEQFMLSMKRLMYE